MPRSFHRSLTTGFVALLILASGAHGQGRSELERVEALSLDILKVGRTTTYHAPGDRERARQLALLSERAAASFEHTLGIAFDFRLAALAPQQWFSPYGGDMPYGIPWSSVAERLIVVPASSVEGALIQGRDLWYDRRMVEFVTIHELGHIANKHYYHPTSAHEEFPLPWFEELLASYFAYAFLRALDPRWTALAQREWRASVGDYTPRVVSLDWSFMRVLPGPELARTYGWYQLVLNLRVADLYAAHGLDFLRRLRNTLPVDTMDAWTTESLLARLEEVAPGFQSWADRFRNEPLSK
jgi:hypothetical protein